MREIDMQNHIGTLLLAWHRYNTGEAGEAEVSQAINYFALKANVETFGKVGNTVPFKPFEHFICDADTPTENVEIDTFGVRAVREDGSHRVIVKALVKSK